MYVLRSLHGMCYDDVFDGFRIELLGRYLGESPGHLLPPSPPPQPDTFSLLRRMNKRRDNISLVSRDEYNLLSIIKEAAGEKKI